MRIAIPKPVIFTNTIVVRITKGGVTTYEKKEDEKGCWEKA